MQQLADGEMLDHYRIVHRLGSGGFSEAYLAVDERSGAQVVLKCPNLTIIGDTQTFERFRREMAISRRLDHPNIQRSLDQGDDRSRPYLVLEYIDGVPLREYLRGRLPLPVDEAVAIVVQLARALDHAHRHGVAHRDLKPENVLVTADGTVKLFDFGIALLSGARRVTWRWLNNSVGTPDYMAPEQIEGKRGDERTDIYALGVMLYEMLTGRVPFRGDNPMAVMNQTLNAKPPDLDSLNPTVPEALAAVVHRCLRKEPTERYASAAALLRDLEHLDDVDPETLQMGPESVRRRRAPSDRQIFVLTGLVTAGFLAVVALIITVYVLVEHR